MSESKNEELFAEKEHLDCKKKELINRIFQSRILATQKIKRKWRDSKHKTLNNSL